LSWRKNRSKPERKEGRKEGGGGEGEGEEEENKLRFRVFSEKRQNQTFHPLA